MDRTRIDVVTARYAIEVEFASKWSNSIGQALYYASITGKNPGIVILKVRDSDQKNIDRLLQVCDPLKIQVWEMSCKNFTIVKLNL
jgi:predicted RecB family endonuclease